MDVFFFLIVRNYSRKYYVVDAVICNPDHDHHVDERDTFVKFRLYVRFRLMQTFLCLRLPSYFCFTVV